jgi:hypothetical protein
VDRYYSELYELILNPYNRVDQEHFSKRCEDLVKKIRSQPYDSPIKEKVNDLITKILSVSVKTTLANVQHELTK